MTYALCASCVQDLRHSIRQLRRSPIFFATAVLLIALGVAATTEIFTLVNALLLRPLPVNHPENLVQLFQRQVKRPADPLLDYGFYRRILQYSSTLTKAVGQVDTTRVLERNGLAERVHSVAVTGNYFGDLGITATLGRVLNGGDRHLVVLSYGYWTRSFERDPRVVGEVVRLQGHPYTIVGVTPEGFTGTTVDSSPDLWTPFADQVELSQNHNPDLDHYVIEVIARLRPGVSLAQAQQESGAIWNRYLREDKSAENGLFAGWLQVQSIEHGVSPIREQSRSGLALLLGGTGLLLLMVCANVGGLLLSRATSRERETAVRIAIGASRVRILREWIVESLILTLLGGLCGMVIAYATLPLLMRWMPPAHGIGFDPGEIRPLALQVRMDWRVMSFCIAVCLGTTLLCAVAPAWRAFQIDINTALKSNLSDHRNRLFQFLLCGIQIALCTMLLIEAGLVIHSLSNLRAADAGFDQDHVTVFSIDPHVRGYDGQKTWRLQRQLLEGVRKLPGVEGAALASEGLMRGIGLGTSVVFPGQTGGVINTSVNSVTPDYFSVMGIRLLAGRNFNDGDMVSKDKLDNVIVNEAFVRKFLNGRNPLGEKFDTGRRFIGAHSEIVGVVSDSKYRSLREIPPPIYYSYKFGPAEYPDSFILHVRSHGDPRKIVEPVRRVLQGIDPEVPLFEVATLSEEVDRSLWQERLLVALASCFGAFALVLSAIALYGILAYFVARRRREIGVRLALGAQPKHVIAVVVKRVVPTLTSGLAAGLVMAWISGRWLQGVLYGVGPMDGWSIGAAVLLIVMIGVAGAAGPVLRAMKLQPAGVLRQD